MQTKVNKQKLLVGQATNSTGHRAEADTAKDCVLPLAHCDVMHTGSLAAMETAQNALTNLGLSLSQAPPVQLTPGQHVAPVLTLRAAVRDALLCQVSQLAFADKVCLAQKTLAPKLLSYLPDTKDFCLCSLICYLCSAVQSSSLHFFDVSGQMSQYTLSVSKANLILHVHTA